MNENEIQVGLINNDCKNLFRVGTFKNLFKERYDELA